jgi:hypothetical protein
VAFSVGFLISSNDWLLLKVKCPFCLKEEQRILGAVFLSAPKEWTKDEATAGDRACNSCLAIIAQMLDHWRGGGINSFIERAKSAGLLVERVEYVERGTRFLNN